MGTSSTGTTGGRSDWGSDFFGTLNEMPSEPVTGIGHILEAMSTLPAFRDARLWVLRNLGITQGSSVIEAGCGNAAALSDILSTVGTKGRVAGIDPTKAFIESARTRAGQLGAANARFEVGDIRSIPFADGEFHAAFCDKVLIHAGPPKAALAEMMRVTRGGGRVGAIEWLPFFAVSSSQPAALDAFNGVFRNAVYEYFISCNLARHFRAAGLKDVRTEAFLAHTDNLDAHPFWRAFIVQQMPMFIHAGLIEEATAQAFLADLEELNAKREFSASFMVQAAVGTK
jgi:ubiquinone/menaquinone biosynthesis C-methylase UbiE